MPVTSMLFVAFVIACLTVFALALAYGERATRQVMLTDNATETTFAKRANRASQKGTPVSPDKPALKQAA